MNLESMLTDVRYARMQLSSVIHTDFHFIGDRARRADDALERIEAALVDELKEQELAQIHLPEDEQNFT